MVAEEVLHCGGTSFASPGWVDVLPISMSPGFEYKETLETGAAAAAAGGYTNIACFTKHQPCCTQ